MKPERANDNLPKDIAFVIDYLRTGGLGEVVMITDAAYRAKQPKVQSDPDMILALCILAQEGIDARAAKEGK
jgi:hypothetical protein